MFINEEKHLVRKGYKLNIEEKTLLSYTKDDKNVTVWYYPFKEKNNYKFSFPISHNNHYATYFTKKDELQKYIRFIINNHL